MDYVAMEDQEKAVGKAALDRQRLTKELAQLSTQVATPLAERLGVLVNILNGVRRYAIDPARKDVVLCQDQVQTPLLYPSAEEIRACLVERKRLQGALEAAETFLKTVLPE